MFTSKIVLLTLLVTLATHMDGDEIITYCKNYGNLIKNGKKTVFNRKTIIGCDNYCFDFRKKVVKIINHLRGNKHVRT